MAEIYMQTPTLNHNFEEYSYENVKAYLENMKRNNDAFGVAAKTSKDIEAFRYAEKEIASYMQLLGRFPDEFPVLHCIHQHGIFLSGEDENAPVDFEFEPIDFRKPEIVTEKHAVADKKEQLELKCTLRDGTKFGLSAVERNGAAGGLLTGQISFPDETLKNLNAKNLASIFDFCELVGFSTFNLDIPMIDGVVDAEGKIAALQKLLDEYKKQKLEEGLVSEDPRKEAEDGISFEEDDYNILSDDALQDAMANLPQEQKTANIPSPTKGQTQKNNSPDFSTVCAGFQKFLEDDLHKKQGLSYWVRNKDINGAKGVVFILYDKEDASNFRNDGRPDSKNPHLYVPTFSYRIYVAKRKDGKLVFGYATPNNKKLDDTMAGDLIGEIKKTGITHLKLTNISNQDKMVLMLACAEKGIVPTGVTINEDKALKMIKAAEGKNLPANELAAFKRRLAGQMEKNAKEKGKTLSPGEKALVQKLKNDALRLVETRKDALDIAEFEEKFHNFRKAYDDTLKHQINRTIMQGSLNKKTGAAESIAAMRTLARTFDVVMGKDANLEATLSERMNDLLLHPIKSREGFVTSVRLTEEEKRALSVIPAEKKIKDLTTEDWQTVYNVLYERQYKEAGANIIQRYKDDEASRAHAKDHILIGEEWTVALGEVISINDRLSQKGAAKLELPDRHRGLSFERPEELKFENIQKKKAEEEAKKKEEEAKKAEPASVPANTKDLGRGM